MAFIALTGISLEGWGQVTVFSDDFSLNQSTSWTTSGTIGSSNWSVTRSGDDWGARRNTSPAQLELANDASVTANVNGWCFTSTQTSAFSSPYNTTLSLNSGLVTWTLNIRQIRTDPAGFSTGSYSVAFILAGSSNNAATVGNGYAILYGQSGTTDPIRLAKYTNGLQGTLTNIITSNTAGLTDFGTEYLSIKVTYNPSTNQWELFLRNDGTSAFSDPSSGSLTSQGTATDNLYTGSGLGYLGYYWQGSTGANQTAFGDNVKVTVASACTPPTGQASAITFSGIGNNSMTVNWTNGNGSKRIVIMNTSNSFTNPTDGTDPTANTVYGGSGQQVVYNNNGSSVSVTGLTQGTTYWFRVYEYNCAGTSTKYFTSTATNNPNSQGTTSCTAPTTQASVLTFSSVGTNQMTVGWTSGNGANRIVIMNTSNSFTNPTNGTSPSANSVYGGSGEQVVYNSNGSNVTVTGLNPGTTYWFRVYEYNCSGTETVYQTNTATDNPLSYATLSCAAPTTQATAITFSDVTNVQMTVSWTIGNGSKRIVIINTSNSFTNPVNGTDPSANAVYGGSGEQVVYNGSGTSVTLSGLSISTTYYFKVYEANCTGSNILFMTPDAVGNPANQTTTALSYSACGSEGFAGGPVAPGGWSFTGITSTYATSGNYGIASPSIKFDDELDQIETADVTSPTQLSFWIKGLSINPNSKFLVEGWDGSSWITIDEFNNIPTTGTILTYNSIGSYTKFRFSYSQKQAGNVALDDVNIVCGSCVMTTFPQLETFDAVGEPSLPCGWTQTNDNSDAEYWITSAANPYSGINSMYIGNTSATMNDWFYTPKLALVAGTTYNISFYFRAGLNTYTEKLEVKWGTTATAAGMTNGPIFSNTSIYNESYIQGTGSFTPGTSGDYYIGFHGYSAANQFELYVDDILITNCSGAPAAPVASAATSNGGTYFTANWASVSSATKYYLDVATDASFTSFVTGFNNKDVGNVTSYNVSGLNVSTTYYYRVRAKNSCGTSLSSNVINLTTLATTSAATIGYGDLVILAVNANMESGGGACVSGSNNGDEISFMCFVDITNGTQIQITDNPYERNYTGSGQWGNTEGGAVLTRTGGTIPAGTVITFRTDMNVTHDVVFIYPDALWSATDLGTNATRTLFNLNNGGDQLYIGQDCQWNGGTNNCATGTCPPSGSGTAACHNATFPGTGRLLFAFSTNPDHPWEASCIDTTTAHDKPTQRSNLYPGMECLNMAPTGSSDYNKYTGPLTPATQREWIDRINSNTNWTSYADCNAYQVTGPQYDDGMLLTILPGGFSDGHWNGSADGNWFNCANWQSMRVPDKYTNVIIPISGVFNEPTIGNPVAYNFVTAECNDLIIENCRTLTMNHSNSRLDIYGDWTQNGTVAFTLGVVNFKDDNSVLSGSGNFDFYNLAMLKTATSNTLTLGSDIIINNILTLTSGVITTDFNKANIINTATSSITGHVIPGSTAFTGYINGNLRRNVLSTGSYDFPVGTATQYEYANINLNSSSGLGYIDAFFTAPHTTPIDISPLGLLVNSDLLMELLNYGFWTITPNAGTYNYDVTLTSRGHTNQGLTAGSHAVIKRPNGASPWVTQGTHDNATQSMGTSWNWVTAKRTALTVFSDFAIAKNNVNSPLPVELLSFSATCDGQNIDLSWTTASESNNAVFTIERSSDAVKWEFVGSVSGNGNSNTRIDYAFSDHNPLSGTAYYRLKQTDYDGRSETFSPVAVICGENADGQGISYYPNPFTSEIQVNLSNVDFKNAVIRVYDMLGNMVFEKNLTAADAESRSTKLNLADLKVGIYTVEFKSESFTNVAKVVKNNYSTRY